MLQHIVDDFCKGSKLAIREFNHRMKYSIKTKEEREEVIKDEPVFTEDCEDWRKAYVAATIHWTATKYNLEVPQWCMCSKYNLQSPWFPEIAKGDLRIILIRESPTEYRFRNIFVSANANEVA